MASAPTTNPPSLWIIAGPNGSGKSSAYGAATVDDLRLPRQRRTEHQTGPHTGSKGRYDVAEDKIRSRRLRSFQQFGWFFTHADRVDVYDNSDATPRRVLAKRGQEMVLYDRLPDEMIDAVEAYDPGFRAIYDN